jgi:hypothetical protein
VFDSAVLLAGKAMLNKVLSRIRRKLGYQLSRRARRDWRHLVANHGWSAVPEELKSRLSRMLARRPPSAGVLDAKSERADERYLSFDQVHNVDTDGLIWGEDLPSGSSNDQWNTAYYATPPSIFRAVLAHLPQEFREGTFIDIGSGKGRAVLMAMDYGFSNCIGVEISPQLYRIAVDNLAEYSRTHQKSQAEFVQQDATSFNFPRGPQVIYFFHPFARPVFQQVLYNLIQDVLADPRAVALIYINPVLREILDQCAYLECIWSGHVDLDPADRVADRIGSLGEDCAIYRLIAMPPADKQ